MSGHGASASAVVRHRLPSEAVGDDFEVVVATCGHRPRSTLVVTDADGLFGLALDTVRLMQIPGLVPPMTLVGVGYPGATSVLDTVERRTRDLTPTPSTTFPGSGGGSAFADFLHHELGPWLERNHAESAGERTYFGHSLGGLFGSWLVLTRPTLFGRYIISSPSLWWDRRHIFQVEASAVPQSSGRMTANVVFGIGSLETDAGRRREARHLPPDDPFKPPTAHLDMVEDMRRFVAQLRSHRHDLGVWSIELEDEFHATVPGVVLSRALRRFYAD